MRLMFPEQCLQATNGDPHLALALAVRITRYRMIGRLELWPGWDEPLPVGVRAMRDRELLAVQPDTIAA